MSEQRFFAAILSPESRDALPALAAQAGERGASLALWSGVLEDTEEARRLLRQTAAESGLWLCGCLKGEKGSLALLTGPNGEETEGYKLHYGGQGSGMALAETPLGRLGLSVGGDLRFPELYRGMALAGARLFLLTDDGDGSLNPEQWEQLTRVRSIENGCCLLAAGQDGGRVLDASGMVTARASEGQALLLGEVDYSYLEQVRQNMPMLRHRREDMYRLQIKTAEAL